MLQAKKVYACCGLESRILWHMEDNHGDSCWPVSALARGVFTETREVALGSFRKRNCCPVSVANLVHTLERSQYYQVYELNCRQYIHKFAIICPPSYYFYTLCTSTQMHFEWCREQYAYIIQKGSLHTSSGAQCLLPIQNHHLDSSPKNSSLHIECFSKVLSLSWLITTKFYHQTSKAPKLSKKHWVLATASSS